MCVCMLQTLIEAFVYCFLMCRWRHCNPRKELKWSTCGVKYPQTRVLHADYLGPPGRMAISLEQPQKTQKLQADDLAVGASLVF